MKYEVSIKEVYITIVSVDADNEDQAREMADSMLIGERLNNGNVAATTYDYTMATDEWDVWEA